MRPLEDDYRVLLFKYFTGKACTVIARSFITEAAVRADLVYCLLATWPQPLLLPNSLEVIDDAASHVMCPKVRGIIKLPHSF